VGAFQAQQAEAAAYLALQQWVAEREGCADSLWRCPITIVVPAGGQAPEDYLHLRTHDLLSNLGLLPRETAIQSGVTPPRRLGTSRQAGQVGVRGNSREGRDSFFHLSELFEKGIP
jgi:hypothetical protein